MTYCVDKAHNLKFHHVGVACNDISKTSQSLNWITSGESSDVIYDPILRASLQLLCVGDGTHIELVSGDAVAPFLKRRQILYHTCYCVDKVGEFADLARKMVWVPITKATPAVLFSGRLVQFFNTPMGIVEILES